MSEVEFSFIASRPHLPAFVKIFVGESSLQRELIMNRLSSTKSKEKSSTQEITLFCPTDSF